MRQILQSLNSGETEVVELPIPVVKPGSLLIASRNTLVSSGTERMLLEFGKSGFIGKARQQPEKVKEVLDKIRTDGLGPTLEAVRSKLDQPIPLGYCNVGTVLEVGSGVSNFAPGDRVVSNGPHAEVVCVPQNLCAHVPEGVGDEEAVFTVLASIALQGVRLAAPTLGEAFVVTGLGLIGLLTVQVLKANGCRVLGIDFDERRLALARKFGAETVNAGKDPVHAASAFSRGRGVDGVLLAAATQSSEPVSQAARMCRKRGRIVLVGVSGLELSRSEFYEKELTFQVSCSYGPGRYDSSYEEGGQDYPIGFVRWTEGRNFEAVLDLMDAQRIAVRDLITHQYSIDSAGEAYNTLSEDRSALGIILEYEADSTDFGRDRTVAPTFRVQPSSSSPVVSFAGAGNYAGRTLIPAFKKSGCSLNTVVTTGGVGGAHYGRKYDFRKISTDWNTALADSETDCIVIATRHNSHSALVCEALRAGKHVFVEKPLALSVEELADIENTYRQVNQGGDADSSGLMLMVGFNRRFSPQIAQIRTLIADIEAPKSFIMTVNAGEIPADHWTQNPKIGGGRIVGEACHFIDLLRHLSGSPIVGFHATCLGASGTNQIPNDKVTVTLEFNDGSFGTIHYLANGHKSFPKERLEIFTAGRILQLDNFRRLNAYGWPKYSGNRLFRQNKGQSECVNAFVQALKCGGASPIPFDEILEVSRCAIEIQDTI